MAEKNTLPRKPKKIIGRAEDILFIDDGDIAVPARIDTGAKTSAIWASDITEGKRLLRFTLLGPEHPHYTGHVHTARHFWKTAVASSNGNVQVRYVVRLRIKLRKKRIIARFTLADRSTQVYPVLVGRNVLRGKFIVDVNLGTPDRDGEIARSHELQSHLKS